MAHFMLNVSHYQRRALVGVSFVVHYCVMRTLVCVTLNILTHTSKYLLFFKSKVSKETNKFSTCEWLQFALVSSSHTRSICQICRRLNVWHGSA